MIIWSLLRIGSLISQGLQKKLGFEVIAPKVSFNKLDSKFVLE